MSTTKKEKLFDLRVVERNIHKGLITREEYEAYLSSLDDASAQSTQIESEFIENVLSQSKDDEA